MSRTYTFSVPDEQVVDLERWSREKGYLTVGAAARVAVIREMARYPSKSVRKVLRDGIRLVEPGGGTAHAAGNDLREAVHG